MQHSYHPTPPPSRICVNLKEMLKFSGTQMSSLHSKCRFCSLFLKDLIFLLLATQLCLFNVINRLSLLLLIHIRAVPHMIDTFSPERK